MSAFSFLVRQSISPCKQTSDISSCKIFPDLAPADQTLSKIKARERQISAMHDPADKVEILQRRFFDSKNPILLRELDEQCLAPPDAGYLPKCFYKPRPIFDA